MHELLELLGNIAIGLLALVGVGFGAIFAANIAETRESELTQEFLVVG
jgi:hypothetical protein